MKPGDVVNKYTVCVKKDKGQIVGHLPLVGSGRFAKLTFYFFFLSRELFQLQCNR